MIPRLYNVPDFRFYQGPLVANTAIVLLDPAHNHNGIFLRRVTGWERAGNSTFTPITALVRSRNTPANAAEALAGMLAISRNGFPCSYAAGAVSDLSATLTFDSREMEFLLPSEGLFLFPFAAVSTCVYSAQFYPDIEQAGR